MYPVPVCEAAYRSTTSLHKLKGGLVDWMLVKERLNNPMHRREQTS